MNDKELAKLVEELYFKGYSYKKALGLVRAIDLFKEVQCIV